MHRFKRKEPTNKCEICGEDWKHANHRPGCDDCSYDERGVLWEFCVACMAEVTESERKKK